MRKRIEYSKDNGSTWHIWLFYHPGQKRTVEDVLKHLQQLYPQ